MRIFTARIFIFATLVAALSFAPITQARADQAFVCDDNSVITVAIQDLEQLKQTNPCIARHFGLSLKKIPTPKIALTPPLPERAPGPILARAPLPAQPATIKIATQLQPGAPITTGTTQRRGPNFRNVIIINARPGAPRIFHHRF